ncbi:DUF6170 family protein [Thalassotalea piscium]
MPLYLSSKQLPELAEYSPRERQVLLTAAQTKFSAPEKFILNILKLIILTPPFLFFARQEFIYLLFALLGSFALYFLVANPLKLLFCRKYIHT